MGININVPSLVYIEWKSIKHVFRILTEQLLFNTRSPKSELTYRNQVVNHGTKYGKDNQLQGLKSHVKIPIW